MAVTVHVFSRHDAFLGTIHESDIFEFTHSDTNNGEDSVSITTSHELHEGYHLVWLDVDGKAHEHVCQDPKALHENGATLYSDTALNSICELYGDYIEDKRPYSYTFAEALETALEPTRWAVGKVDQSGTVSSGLTFYHTSAREAVQAILECGGELETAITFTGGAISKRAVNILAHRGESSTHRRFSYGKDITSCAKTESYGAITACYGYGKGVETDSGGYGRKLTFEDVNPTGLKYVEDDEALAKYGRPDGQGGYAHIFGEYENSECEDASQLLSETQEYLANHNEPGVTYEVNAVDLRQFGRTWEGVGVGDDVQIVDAEFSPELRCTGRVSKLVRDYIGGTTEVTFGNVSETLAGMMNSQQAELANISRKSSNWDMAGTANPSWLQTLMDGLNDRFNTSGASYTYTSFTAGTIWASVPMDDEGKPTKTGGTAIQICSEGLRIASGTKSDGTWNWTTFGTGEGFTADAINAGTIDASNVNIKNLMEIGDDENSVKITGSKIAFAVDNTESVSITPSSYMNRVTHIYPGCGHSGINATTKDKLFLAKTASSGTSMGSFSFSVNLYGRLPASVKIYPYMLACIGNSTTISVERINNTTPNSGTKAMNTDDVLTETGASLWFTGAPDWMPYLHCRLKGDSLSNVTMTITGRTSAANHGKYGLLYFLIQLPMDVPGAKIIGAQNSFLAPSEFSSTDTLFSHLSNLGKGYSSVTGASEIGGGYTGVVFRPSATESCVDRDVYISGLLAASHTAVSTSGSVF